jgi:hypothetical protein
MRWLGMLLSGVVFLGVELAFWTAASAQAQPTVAGRYSCHGTQKDGKTYDLELVVQAEGEAFLLGWFKDGQQAYEGIGFVADGYFSAISVGFDGKNLVASAVLYKVSPARLDGKWTGGTGDVNHEVCTRGRSNL